MAKLTKDDAIKLAEQSLEKNGMAGDLIRAFEPSEFGVWSIIFQRRIPVEERSPLSFITVYIVDESEQVSLKLHW